MISTMQQSTIQGAAENQGHARRIAKFAAHGAACQAAGISFIPLAVETLGGLSVTAADTISSIGHLMGQRFRISPSESTCHLFQRLSISLWRGNHLDPPQPITCTLRGRSCLAVTCLFFAFIFAVYSCCIIYVYGWEKITGLDYCAHPQQTRAREPRRYNSYLAQGNYHE